MKHAVASFSGFSVTSISMAKEFYVDKLELVLVSEHMGLELALPGGSKLFVYEKPDHIAATFTVLNFVVDNIDEAVTDLTAKGVVFERYEMGNGAAQDEMGVLRGLAANRGPDIAWFKDPVGNILSVLREKMVANFSNIL